ncbi:MAG TPA: diacylglycerol kinase family lipid kinase [Clostridiaceae bacterium]|nr:diacylglycerol kinase family lipid kinase [Clostridiaceae bacterium]
MNHLFIINPVAGQGKPLKLIPEIKKIFSSRNDTFKIEITERPGHATDIAKEYTSQKKYRVYSIGGDGTLNEVLNGMVNSGSSLAVIPAGSGNDFSRNLNLNIASKRYSYDILNRTINGKEEPVDIVKINNRYFINISSVGLDAEVANTTNKLKRTGLLRGSFAYLVGIFATLLKYNSHILRVTIDGQTFEKESLLLAIANGKFYGGGVQPAPDASINDGLLDVCFVKKMSVFKIVRLLPLYYKGKHGGLEEVTFFKGKKIEVCNNHEMALNIDGEITMVKNAVYEIIPKGINLVIPSQS